VVLDGAATADQVRPLLPAGLGCGVLVTSRHILGSLDGASHLHLGVLDPAEAVALLGGLAGTDRIAVEPESAEALVELCGRLPLAVRIAGARLAARPSWTVETLRRRLAASHRRLDELAVGDQAVRASFEVSYQALRAAARPGEASDASLFRLLGLLDVPDLTAPVVAAPVGRPPLPTEEALERLVDGHLLETPSPGRYRMHDLLRLFARECCTAEEPEAVRVEALNRALHWYLAVAVRASRLLYPADQRRVASVSDAGDGVALRDRAEALTWLEAERVNLLAAVRQAATSPGVPSDVVGHLATALFRFLEMRGSWHDLGAIDQLALQAARRSGDPHAEAQALNDLAVTYYRLGQLDQAAAYSERTLAMRRKLGDRVAEGQALSNLAIMWHALGQLDRHWPATSRAWRSSARPASMPASAASWATSVASTRTSAASTTRSPASSRRSPSTRTSVTPTAWAAASATSASSTASSAASTTRSPASSRRSPSTATWATATWRGSTSGTWEPCWTRTGGTRRRGPAGARPWPSFSRSARQKPTRFWRCSTPWTSARPAGPDPGRRAGRPA
jgi:tetratricopeptide (TPR) repeat protein